VVESETENDLPFNVPDIVYTFHIIC
jgi:hypothetical protein